MRIFRRLSLLLLLLQIGHLSLCQRQCGLQLVALGLEKSE
jgi:hypothetical protein